MHIVFLQKEAYLPYVVPVIEMLTASGRAEVTVIPPETVLAEGETALNRLCRADLVVTVHSTLDTVRQIMEALRGKVPTLTLQDGVIEYRSQKHRSQGLFRYRPLMTDYIGVFGPRSGQLIQAAGTEPHRILETGAPRFDPYLADQQSLPPPGEGYLLVTVSNRPAYGQDSLIRFYIAIAALLRHLQHNGVRFLLRKSRGTRPGGMEHPGKVRDLLPQGVAELFENAGDSSRTLQDDLRGAYGVITTPSTPSLEAMAMGRRLCHLLFDPETVYASSAWTLHDPERDSARVLAELRDPPRFKMEYQSLLLQENLSYQGNSTARCCQVIEDLASGRHP